MYITYEQYVSIIQQYKEFIILLGICKNIPEIKASFINPLTKLLIIPGKKNIYHQDKNKPLIFA